MSKTCCSSSQEGQAMAHASASGDTVSCHTSASDHQAQAKASTQDSCCSSSASASSASSSSHSTASASSAAAAVSSCCGSTSSPAANSTKSTASCCDTPKGRIDYLLWGSLTGVLVGYANYLFASYLGVEHTANALLTMSHAIYDLLNTMAWGLVLGVFMVALLSKVPRDLVMSVLGTHGGFNGMLRATGAGLLLDLCSHGILMVGAKLYERGASIGQVMAFLIASPWNSFSLTLILIALIGFGWTIAFILLSAVIAIATGLIFDALVKRGTLPANPNSTPLDDDFQFWPAARAALTQGNYSRAGWWQFVKDGVRESRMVIRWLMFGILLAALIRTFVPPDYFSQYFGPTALGLAVTLIAATVLEVCSEGSTPIAADIFTRAAAPGNSFGFLMTGVSTDYTEIMVLKDTTRSWKIALFLPLITLPQVVVVALVLNGFSG